MTELASTKAFYELAKTGNYSKTWLTNKINQMQRHETRMKFMDWLARDEEAKYYAGVALGAATGAMGKLLDEFMSAAAPTPEDQGQVITVEVGPPPELLPWLWLGGPGGFAALGGIAIKEKVKQIGDSPLGGTGPLSFVPNVMQLGGVGFAGFCASVLILKAIFSGTDLGELLSGVGEIIPL